jgi:hypothetical protein
MLSSGPKRRGHRSGVWDSMPSVKKGTSMDVPASLVSDAAVAGGYLLVFRGLAVVGCRRGDLNPHALSGTTPSRWRVYQFHHFGIQEV